jgi:hypothetical protein
MEKTKMHKLTEFQFFGITFYEHPLLGDEVGYLVKKNGRYAQSDLFDKPASREEAQDAFDTATEWPA